MLTVLYAGCPSLSLAISAQFALEMCVTVKNRKKYIKNLYFSIQGHSRSLLLVPIKSQCTTSY